MLQLKTPHVATGIRRSQIKIFVFFGGKKNKKKNPGSGKQPLTPVCGAPSPSRDKREEIKVGWITGRSAQARSGDRQPQAAPSSVSP